MIKLNNLCTGYSRDRPLLRNFNYEFDNKIYGILGESGCGKTTLLKTIAGLMNPLDGEILVDNEKLQKANKNNIYMLHQNYTSFDWMDCLENILIAKKIKGTVNESDIKKAISILKRVGLGNYLKKYPKQLSGGQRQRLALARTLYMDPQIILMDEPLSALDESTRTDMQNMIMEIHRLLNNTIIMVTHSKNEANKMCNVIINLEKEGD